MDDFHATCVTCDRQVRLPRSVHLVELARAFLRHESCLTSVDLHDLRDLLADAARAPEPPCPGCLGSGECWVCLGSGSRDTERLRGTCGSCGGSRRCRYCPPPLPGQRAQNGLLA